MTKYIGFIICLLISIGILTLALIQEQIFCSAANNYCAIKSYIPGININVSEEKFSANELIALNVYLSL